MYLVSVLRVYSSHAHTLCRDRDDSRARQSLLSQSVKRQLNRGGSSRVENFAPPNKQKIEIARGGGVMDFEFVFTAGVYCRSLLGRLHMYLDPRRLCLID